MSDSKTVIITGSSSGLGLDLARTLVEQGHRVVLNGRDEVKLEAAVDALNSPERVAAVAGNIASAETGTALVDAAKQRFGHVDALVNNAGTFGLKAFVDVSEDELDGFLQGNLRGTYLTTQAVVRQMKEQGRGGAIVNIGTVLVDHAAADVACSAPIVSKGGIHALTVSLAAELASDSIRVNAVAPGMVRTPLHGDADMKALGSVALLDRVGEAHEITESILYLLDADFVTGQILNVDGGYVAGRA